MLWSYNERRKYTIYIFYVYIFGGSAVSGLRVCTTHCPRGDIFWNVWIVTEISGFFCFPFRIVWYIIVCLAHGSYNHHNWKRKCLVSGTPDVRVNSVKVVVFNIRDGKKCFLILILKYLNSFTFCYRCPMIQRADLKFFQGVIHSSPISL